MLRRLASLDVPTDDAVEAEMLAQLLDPDPPVDEIEQLTVSLTVRDVDTVIERLTDDRRTLLVNVDPRTFRHDEDEPPPRSVYTLLDRAMPASDTNLAEISGDDLAAVLGLVTVHGRQTDREPRVELRTYRDATLEVANGIVREILGDQIDGEPIETADGGVPAETVILGCNWHFPDGTPVDRRLELQHEFRQQAFLTKWPEHPLALLGGKTPREAAADPALKIRLLAHLNILELGEQRSDSNVDIDAVREELGLVKPESIDPEVHDPRSVPLVRLARLEMDKLAPEQTVTVFYRLLATNAHAGLRKLVPVMIERGDFDATQETAVKTLTLSEAYCLMADLAGRSPLAIAYLEKARQAADDAGESNAVVDIQELSIHIEREETAEFSRLVEHVLSAHGNEPGVRETVFSLLAQLGLITPDGRPMAPSVGAPATAPAATASGGGSSEIWTPESEQSGGGKSLWLPGSD